MATPSVHTSREDGKRVLQLKTSPLLTLFILLFAVVPVFCTLYLPESRLPYPKPVMYAAGLALAGLAIWSATRKSRAIVEPGVSVTSEVKPMFGAMKAETYPAGEIAEVAVLRREVRVRHTSTEIYHLGLRLTDGREVELFNLGQDRKRCRELELLVSRDLGLRDGPA